MFFRVFPRWVALVAFAFVGPVSAAAEKAPDGLCFLKHGARVVAEGVVVGHRLLSRAAVLLDYRPGQWFCAQNGKLVPLRLDAEKPPWVHRAYERPEIWLGDLERYSGGTIALLVDALDLASIPLRSPAPTSAFVLDPSETNLSHVRLGESLGAKDMDALVLKGDGTMMRFESEKGFVGIGMHFEAPGVHIEHSTKKEFPVRLFADHWKMPDGADGAPLVSPMKDGRYLVSGVFVRHSTMLASAPGWDELFGHEPPATFASVHSFVDWKARAPELFFAPCVTGVSAPGAGADAVTFLDGPTPSR